MIKRNAELVPEVVAGLRGGKGSVIMTKLLKDAEFQGKGRLFNRMVLKPCCSIGYHQHVGEIEVFYILSGEGILDDNGTKSAVRAGDVAFTGNGESHSIENTGSEDLVFIALILFA